ncbi:MAG: ABC transporter permease [Actinomycetia bacterium]|nr:ABC transporter permease [Actinomycetes bacterium]
MSVEADLPLASPRSIRWSRRRASLAETGRRIRKDRLAVIALLVLIGFVLLAIITPWITDRADFNAINTGNNPTNQPPNGDYLLGTDRYGRSVALQLMWGARVSLFVGFVATVLTIVIGVLIGLAAGFFGGWIDALLMRITDWFLVIPFLPTAIVLAAVLERSLWTVVLVIGITSWPSSARLVRSQVLSVRERLYVDRARALGAGRLHIVGRHILPNVTPLILASATLAVPISILTETTLSFLGLGDPTSISWGGMLDQAQQSSAVTAGHWWYYLPPGIAIMLVVLAFTIFGRALEEVLDPRLRAR